MEEHKEAVGAEAKEPKRKSRRLAEKKGATDVPDEEAAGKTNNHIIILSSCKLCLNQQPLSAIRSSNDHDLDFRHPSLNKSGGGAMEEFGQESNLAAAAAAASTKKVGRPKKMAGPEVFKDPAAAAARKKNDDVDGADEEAEEVAASGEEGDDEEGAGRKKMEIVADNNNGTDDDDDNKDGNAAVRAYIAAGAQDRPSEQVLGSFEQHPYASMLMAEEMTGFADQNKQEIHDSLIDSDFDVRKQAQIDFVKFAKSFGPNPEELIDIHQRYYSGCGDPKAVLQTCGVCGMTGFASEIACSSYPLDRSFMSSPLRLKP